MMFEFDSNWPTEEPIGERITRAITEESHVVVGDERMTRLRPGTVRAIVATLVITVAVAIGVLAASLPAPQCFQEICR